MNCPLSFGTLAFFKDPRNNLSPNSFSQIARMHSEPFLQHLPKSTHVAPIPDSRLQL